MSKRFRRLKKNSAGFSRDEMAELLKDVRAHFTHQKRISRYNRARDDLMAGKGLSRTAMIGYQAYLKTRFNDVKRLYDRLRDAAGAKRKYRNAKAAYDKLRGQHKIFRACVQKYVQQLAQKNGWNPRLVRGISSSAY